MKKIIFSMFIILICQHSNAQSDLVSLSLTHKISLFANLKSTMPVADSTLTGTTPETSDASATIPAFYARRNKKNVELTWQPFSDESKSVFIIQRKSDGDWVTIAYIPCSSTSNDQLPSIYTYTDVNTFKSETQYQIKEVIDHGNTRSSGVLPVQPEGTNPFDATLYTSSGKIRLAFKTDDVRDIKIFNDKGRLLQEANQVSDKNIQLAVQAEGTLHLLVREQSTGAVTAGEIYIR